MTNVELGPIPEQFISMHGLSGAAAVYRPWRRRIDAVSWWPDHYDLIEFKLRDPLQGLGRLHSYYVLAPQTPDLIAYEGQPFRKVLVVPFALDWIKVAAQGDEVELIEFWQDWVLDYWKQFDRYFTAEYRAAREEMLRLRVIMGLDKPQLPI